MSNILNFDKIEQGQRLKSIRKYLKMSQSKFCSTVLQCEQGYYSQVERGEKSISYGIIQDISNRFREASNGENINLNWLLLGIGEMFLVPHHKNFFNDNQGIVSIDSKLGNNNVITQNNNNSLAESAEIIYQKDLEIARLAGQIDLLKELLAKK